jgi:hypothetical protein
MKIYSFYPGFPISVLSHQIIVQLLLYALSGYLWFVMLFISATFTPYIFTLLLFVFT